MKHEDYKNKFDELQSEVSNVFEKIKNTGCPALENTEWYTTQLNHLAYCVDELNRIHNEFRHLQAEHYDLLVPEEQPGLDQNYDPDLQEKEVEIQAEELTNPATEIATAVAGVGAIINLFRKARG